MKYFKWIEIENYKLFKNFKIENFGDINLISGDNNIGKTALMEALLLVSEKNSIKHYLFLLNIIFKSRMNCDNSKIVNEFIDMLIRLNHIKIKSNLNELELIISQNLEVYLELIDENSDKEIEELSNKIKNPLIIEEIKNKLFKIELSPNNLANILNFEKIEVLNFIHNLNNREEILNGLINELKKDIELYEKFNEELENFDKNLLKIDIIDNKVSIYLKNIKKWLYIKELGEGTQNFVAILSVLFVNKNKIIYIDEIENGIYYSKFKQMWKLIFEYTKKFNIQLFITTHSKEIIETYSQIANENILDAKFIDFFKKDKIITTIYDKNSLKFLLDNNQEIR